MVDSKLHEKRAIAVLWPLNYQRANQKHQHHHTWGKIFNGKCSWYTFEALLHKGQAIIRRQENQFPSHNHA